MLCVFFFFFWGVGGGVLRDIRTCINNVKANITCSLEENLELSSSFCYCYRKLEYTSEIKHLSASTFKLIQAYGNPVGVSNAGRKRRPKSSARTRS